MIIRGTTVTQYFNIPFNWSDVVDCYVSYGYKGETVIEKDINVLTYDHAKEAIRVNLTEEDTFSLPKIGIRSRPVDSLLIIQLSVVLKNNTVHRSFPIKTRFFGVVKEGLVGNHGIVSPSNQAQQSQDYFYARFDFGNLDLDGDDKLVALYDGGDINGYSQEQGSEGIVDDGIVIYDGGDVYGYQENI